MNKIGRRSVKIFQIKNRKGYAAICCDHLTEGKTSSEVFARMEKAIKLTEKKENKAKAKKK